MHRYFFVLLKQRNVISTKSLSDYIEYCQEQRNDTSFVLSRFIKRMNYTCPVAINGFYASWEEYCDKLNDNYHIIPPEPFRSPIQDSKVMIAIEKQRIQVAKLTLFQELQLTDLFVTMKESDLMQQQQQSSVSQSAAATSTTTTNNNNNNSMFEEFPIIALKFGSQFINMNQLSSSSSSSTSSSSSSISSSLSSSSSSSKWTCLEGMMIPASNTMTAPEIYIHIVDNSSNISSSGTLYFTLMFVDLDMPSRLESNRYEYIHWLVVNIPPSSSSSSPDSETAVTSVGETILSYLPPMPPFASGLHRYVFVLYLQQDFFVTTDLTMIRTHFINEKKQEQRIQNRSQEKLQEILSSQIIVTPIAFDAFLTEYEAHVDRLHTQIGLSLPEQYLPTSHLM
jgi:phosphatidylethanolamine-binding protein (PEBP) family uncharacterized protein